MICVRFQKLSVLFLLGLCLVCHSGIAQESEKEQQDRIKRTKVFLTELKRIDYGLQLLAQIEQLNDQLKLEPIQLKKLGIAAKSASSRHVKDWAKQMEEGNNWEWVIDEVVIDPDTDIENINPDDIDPNVLQWVNELDLMDFSVHAVKNSKFWQKTLASVLNDAQQKRYAELEIAKKESANQATADYLAATYKPALAMNDEQVKKLATRFKKALNKHSLIVAPAMLDIQISRIASIPDTDIKTILSETQFKIWHNATAAYRPGGMMRTEPWEFGLEEEMDDAEEGEVDNPGNAADDG